MIEKFKLLNETILDCLDEKNEVKIVKAFTEVGVKILGADFGFVWLKQPSDNQWKLVYKSPNLPFQPNKPRLEGVNYEVVNSGKIAYIKKFKSTPHNSDAGKYMKSLMIIPISYKGETYGTIVLCFKKSESFSKEKKLLSTFTGNAIAQEMTISRSHSKTEKLKETEILLEQEKSKTEFVANAVHEFRTPLAIIRGNVELALLNKTPVISAYKKVLNITNKEIVHLSALLMDLAVLTKPKKYEKNTIHLAQVNISKLLKKIVTRINILARNKKVSLKLVDNSMGITIMGDEKYLEKVFLNLLRNAIAYSKDKGKVLIRIDKEKDNVIIKVIDNGVGISKNELPHIFERFFRTEKARTMRNTGMGLGLALSKWVVDSHKGTIDVKSVEGRGTNFTVTLPIKSI